MIAAEVLALSEKGFLELLHREEGKLYRIALAILGNEADAWDALQQAVEQAWRKRNTLRGSDDAFPAWIKRIVINRSINLLRARERVIPVDPSSMFPSSAINGQEYDEIRMVWELVQELGPEYRKVIALRYLGDMSLREIASALGIPLGTVKSRLNTAHHRLKQLMEDNEMKGAGELDAIV